jgi:hypothetical protein
VSDTHDEPESVRNRDAKRLIAMESRQFSTQACQPGTYSRTSAPKQVCLRSNIATDNLHETIREAANRVTLPGLARLDVGIHDVWSRFVYCRGML